MKKKKIKVLFVCLGNICRSPTAEGIFRSYVGANGYLDDFEIGSAGLSAYHHGEKADPRMRKHASLRGYTLDSISRPITYEDFLAYDYIIGMDEHNREELLERAPTEACREKVSLLTDWNEHASKDHVPDPYYGGEEGFEEVLDIIEDCVPHIVRQMLCDERSSLS